MDSDPTNLVTSQFQSHFLEIVDSTRKVPLEKLMKQDPGVERVLGKATYEGYKHFGFFKEVGERVAEYYMRLQG